MLITFQALAEFRKKHVEQRNILKFKWQWHLFLLHPVNSSLTAS